MEGSINWLSLPLLLGLFALVVGSIVSARFRTQAARSLADQIIASAQREAETIRIQAVLEAKSELLRRRDELENEIEEFRRELREQERRLEKRDGLLDQKLELLNQKEREFDARRLKLADLEADLRRRQEETSRLQAEQLELLERIGSLSADEARQLLQQRVEETLQGDFEAQLAKHEAILRETSERRAREIVTMAIQRYAAPHTAEVTVSTVDIPNDEMKGRIIGREGRNIRAFEKATGVDLIVDDTPGVVIITGFDSLRREVAKLALERLIQDGRIQPTRIEEIVRETQEGIEHQIHRIGLEAAQEVGLVGLHDKLLDYLGRLKFRTSYSQNVLRHSIEVSFLTGMMAEELGLSGSLGRRCGLLHDIGKAADHEMEGGHPSVGAELAKRYGEGPEVVHAILGHHDDLRVDAPYTVLVAAADAISASRPGARRQTLEKYVRRLEELEAVALGFPGVEQAYAIQAGREVRVIVDSQQIDDHAAAALCRLVARAIQERLSYPGEVKVTVVRETRAVEFAR